MNEEIIINLLLIKGFKTIFESEKRNFDNLTYTNFNSSYIKRCSDKYVSQMSNKLSPLYEKIKNKYTNINDWWTQYNDNVDALEEALSSEMRNYSTLDASISSYVRTLPELEDYDIKLAGIINSNLILPNNNEIFLSSSSIPRNGTAYLQTKAIVASESNSALDNIRYKWRTETIPWLINTALNIKKVQDSVCATIGTFFTSVGEGLGRFCESIVDVALLAGSGLAQAETMKTAQDQLMFSVATGNEPMYTYDDAMETNENIQESTMATVSNKYVETWFNDMYDTTNYGRILKNKSYAFETVRNAGVEVGYTAGVVGTTVLTFGAGGVATAGGITSSQLATVAGVAGIGKGTQNAWADGATYDEGISYGLLNGVWEGTQFYLGGKIGTSSFISNRFLNSTLRIVMDGVDSGAEGIVQPLLNMVYKDGYIDQSGNFIEFSENDNRYSLLFNEAGGWSNVGLNVAIGAGMSFVGEAGDLTRLLKPKSNKSGIEVLEFNQKANTTNDMGYRLNTKSLKNEALTHIYEDVNNLGYMPQELGEFLESTFTDPDYIYGIHRTSTSNTNKIMQQGLLLTGDSSTSAFTNAIDLEKNISFYRRNSDNDNALMLLVKELKTAHIYKTLEDVGDSIIIRIPKSEYNDLSKLICYENNTPYLKPEYVMGYVRSNNGNLSQLNYKNNSSISDVANAELNEISNPSINSKIDPSLQPLIDEINKSSFQYKEKLLNLIEVFSTNKESNPYAINFIVRTYYNTLSNGNKNALVQLDKLIEVKTEFPNFFLSMDFEDNRACWDYLDETVLLGGSYSEFNSIGVPIHEVGHLTFDLSGAVPIDWKKRFYNAQVNASGNPALKKYYDHFNNVMDVELTNAEKTFEEILRKKGMNLEEYSSQIYNNYKVSIEEYRTNFDELNEIFIDVFDIKSDLIRQNLIEKLMGAPEDIDYTLNYLVNISIDREIEAIRQVTVFRNNPEVLALSDMLDAVFEGQKRDLFGNRVNIVFGHGEKYYKNRINYQIHELMANYNILKNACTSDLSPYVQEIFGKEFYYTLETMYDMSMKPYN